MTLCNLLTSVFLGLQSLVTSPQAWDWEGLWGTCHHAIVQRVPALLLHRKGAYSKWKPLHPFALLSLARPLCQIPRNCGEILWMEVSSNTVTYFSFCFSSYTFQWILTVLVQNIVFLSVWSICRPYHEKWNSTALIALNALWIQFTN